MTPIRLDKGYLTMDSTDITKLKENILDNLVLTNLKVQMNWETSATIQLTESAAREIA